MHKLSVASKKINEHLEKREFSLSTQVAYKYFYEFLCDTYIENSKAIFDEGSAEEKESAAQTLYTAIEGGLLMIHPFMPFLTVSFRELDFLTFANIVSGGALATPAPERRRYYPLRHRRGIP